MLVSHVVLLWGTSSVRHFLVVFPCLWLSLWVLILRKRPIKEAATFALLKY
uniref:Uncharacterized protein n=1 Tax=Rhizophora mucronata TaxID=61149 RepID=A0A2P2N887_RHIMU